jgi:hypothetical protein
MIPPLEVSDSPTVLGFAGTPQWRLDHLPQARLK